MDFARQQRDPARHVIGITFVILMHVLLIWALISGLGRKVVEVIKKPLTATIIEEIKAPPPPPPPPPPKKIIEARRFRRLNLMFRHRTCQCLRLSSPSSRRPWRHRRPSPT
jgi:hypothetical protein